MSWLDEFDERLAALDAQSLRRVRRAVQPLDGARLLVDGVPMLAFCSNDYLGLANDPVLREAASLAIARHGIGAGASPLVSGHSTANAALERELAEAAGLPRALYFSSGFSTNASVVPALVSKGDALFSDALNHASLIDGARLSGATIHRYAHADLADLDAQLAASTAARKLIISDAVFSMDGDIADIRALHALAERHDALLMLDDAHGFGLLGPQGRGALAQAGLVGANAARRVLYMATLGKAMGVAGAFVAGDASLIEWLLQRTRGYIFATAAPALLAEALRAALQCALGAEGERRRTHLQGLIAQLRTGLDSMVSGTDTHADQREDANTGTGTRKPTNQPAGWRLLPSSTPIQALIVGSNEAALAVMAQLRERGLWVPAIRPPTVPAGTARLRITLSAAHTAADVESLVVALREIAPAFA